jgi:hypothetical protein
MSAQLSNLLAAVDGLLAGVRESKHNTASRDGEAAAVVLPGTLRALRTARAEYAKHVATLPGEADDVP